MINLIAKLIARRARKFQQAVKLVESQGLTVCEITTKAGTDYIRAQDGSWRVIGGMRKRDNARKALPKLTKFDPTIGY